MTSYKCLGGDAVVSAFLAYILDHFTGLSQPWLVETWLSQGFAVAESTQSKILFLVR